MTAAMGFTSMAGLYDYQRGLAAVIAARDALEREGVPRTKIDAGYSPNGADLYRFADQPEEEDSIERQQGIPMITSSRPRRLHDRRRADRRHGDRPPPRLAGRMRQRPPRSVRAPQNERHGCAEQTARSSWLRKPLPLFRGRGGERIALAVRVQAAVTLTCLGAPRRPLPQLRASMHLLTARPSFLQNRANGSESTGASTADGTGAADGEEPPLSRQRPGRYAALLAGEEMSRAWGLLKWLISSPVSGFFSTWRSVYGPAI